jgi:hypothetical protein
VTRLIKGDAEAKPISIIPGKIFLPISASRRGRQKSEILICPPFNHLCKTNIVAVTIKSPAETAMQRILANFSFRDESRKPTG